MNYAPFIKRVHELTNQSGKRSCLQIEFIYNELSKITPLIEYIQEPDSEKEKQILFELSKYLKHKKFHKGSFIRQIYDNDNYFCVVFNGQNVVKVEIAYSRVYLTYRQYILYLLKLKFLGEINLFKYCITKNRKVIPLNLNTSNFLKENNIYFYDLEEIIQVIKKNIQNSNWKSNPNKIENFFELYNPEYLRPAVKNNINAVFRKAKFPIDLPYFIYDKNMENISFIGELNKPKGIKTFSSFVCIGECDVFYVELKKLNESDPKNNIYNLLNNSKTDIILEKIYKSFFIFKDLNFDLLSKSYSKYFRKVVLNKNQILIEQDKLYEGVFFIIKGEYEVKTLKSYNELENFKFQLLHSIDNYPRSIPIYQANMENLVNNKINEKNRPFLKKFELLKKNANFVKKLNQKNEILIDKIQKNEMIGFQNFYNPNNFINYFTVECISDEGEAYFLPRELVTSLSSNDSINLKIGDIIGERCTYILNEINRYKEKFEKEIVFLFHTNSENYNHKGNTINNYFKTKMSHKILNSENNIKNINNYCNTNNSLLSINDINNTLKINKNKSEVKLQKSLNYLLNKNKTQILINDNSKEKYINSNKIISYENTKSVFKRKCFTAKNLHSQFVQDNKKCKICKTTVDFDDKKFIKRRTVDFLSKKFDKILKNIGDRKEKKLLNYIPLTPECSNTKFILSKTNQKKDNKIKLVTILGNLSKNRNKKEFKTILTKSDMDFTKESKIIKKTKNVFRQKILKSKEFSFADNKISILKLKNFDKK